MSANAISIKPKRPYRLKGIILPTEHGSWGFLFEPLLAGVLLAPSLPAIWISLLFIGAFLTRQPLKILLSDLSAKRKLPQTSAALKFTLIFGSISAIGLLGSILSSKSEVFFPLLLVFPFGIYQIYCDVGKQARQLLPEITGAVAISSSIAVITLAGNWTWAESFALWSVFVARLIPSILYVRNRLRLEKDKDFYFIPVIVSHFIAFGLIGMLAANGLISKLALTMFFVLLIRAFWGLSPFRKKAKAMKIGVWEVIYGTLTALSVVLGYYLQI